MGDATPKAPSQKPLAMPPLSYIAGIATESLYMRPCLGDIHTSVSENSPRLTAISGNNRIIFTHLRMSTTIIPKLRCISGNHGNHIKSLDVVWKTMSITFTERVN